MTFGTNCGGSDKFRAAFSRQKLKFQLLANASTNKCPKTSENSCAAFSVRILRKYSYEVEKQPAKMHDVLAKC